MLVGGYRRYPLLGGEEKRGVFKAGRCLLGDSAFSAQLLGNFPGALGVLTSVHALHGS